MQLEKSKLNAFLPKDAILGPKGKMLTSTEAMSNLKREKSFLLFVFCFFFFFLGGTEV
jgi:hypothetical protein